MSDTKTVVTAKVDQNARGLELAEYVLGLIDRQNAKPFDGKFPGFGKAIGLLGGGSVYINRGNADVRSLPKQIHEWEKAGIGVARGSHRQYLRITFPKPQQG